MRLNCVERPINPNKFLKGEYTNTIARIKLEQFTLQDAYERKYYYFQNKATMLISFISPFYIVLLK